MREEKPEKNKELEREKRCLRKEGKLGNGGITGLGLN